VELRVTQPGFSYPIQCWSWNHTAESAGDSIALIVGYDEKDIWRSLGRHYARRPPGRGLGCALFNNTAEFHRGRWKGLPVNRNLGIRRAKHTSDLLRQGRQPKSTHDYSKSQY
jgi:hypothetical protein